MKKTNLLIGFHCHQPVGNFDFIIENAVNKSYKPLVETFYNFPDIKVSFHFSGILYEYFQKKHIELIKKLKEMVNRKQVEILSGGFYEPILPIIPERDALEQIRWMNEFIIKNFGTIPQGIWLTERIWEPHLPSTLKKANIKFSIVDDTHLLSGGISENEIFNYFITENNGNRVFIFPISKKMRYLVPFKELKETFDFLKKKKGKLIVMADDGEKFGVWPGTYKRVYEDNYLKDFLETLSNDKEIQTLTFSEVIEKIKPLGPVYLPTASYSEMMEWVLPTDDRIIFENLEKESDENTKKFLKGGYFRNFFVKYNEANHMHKKMLEVSDNLKNTKNKKAKRALFRAQCNCAYWHGIFGGLYLPHLRQAIYKNLIEAEKGYQTVSEKKDMDYDGIEEAILRNKKINAYIHLKGGKIVELDYKEPPYNLMNVLTRRRESYHRFIKSKGNFDGTKTIHEVITSKEKGLDKLLKYDATTLGMFGDVFIKRGKQIVDPLYNISNLFEDTVELVTENVTKTYFLLDTALSVHYNFRGELFENVKINLPVATFSDNIKEGNKGIVIEDCFDKKKFIIEYSLPMKLTREIIYTISSSESGLEKTRQGLLFTFIYENPIGLKFDLSIK